MSPCSAILLLVLAVATAEQEIKTLEDVANTLLLNQLAISNVLAERDSDTRVIRELLNDVQSNITFVLSALQDAIKGCSTGRGAKPVSNRVVECVSPFTSVHGHCIAVEAALTGSWETMRRHCQQKGGEIAKVDSDNFMYYLVRFLHSNGMATKKYWVGGRDEGVKGSFFLTDGTQVKMGTPFWGHGVSENFHEPDGATAQNCIGMIRDDHYFLFQIPCNEKNGVICEKI